MAVDVVTDVCKDMGILEPTEIKEFFVLARRLQGKSVNFIKGL